MDKQLYTQVAQSLGIGNTPLIPYEEDFDADIFIKNEAMNATGSIKDRAALAMVLDAEENGVLRKGDTIVEASSGNLGISLAYVGVNRGYKVVIAMPDNVSEERRALIEGLGAKLILTDGAQGMQGALNKVQELTKTAGNVWLNQFENAANPLAHYCCTGEELLSQLDKIDVLVAGVGSGGTLMGTARRVKEKFPQCKVVAVEPANSAVLSGKDKGKHIVQGIGAGFVPKIYDASLVDSVQVVTDDEVMDMFLILNKKQGYCCGLSSAANILVATRYASDPTYKGQNIVTFFPDGDDRYFSLLKSVK